MVATILRETAAGKLLPIESARSGEFSTKGALDVPEEPELAEFLGSNAQCYAEKRYDIVKIVDQFERPILDEAAAHSSMSTGPIPGSVVQ